MGVVPVTKTPPTLVHQPCPFEDCGSSDAFSYWSKGLASASHATRVTPQPRGSLTGQKKPTHPSRLSQT